MQRAEAAPPSVAQTPLSVTDQLHKIIEQAVASRAKHFTVGQPMTSIGEGFKEANIAHDLSSAFQSHSYLVYPEFPFAGGSIDALFVRDDELVLCEWKRCYAGSCGSIVEQTQRMLRFDPSAELPKHGFARRCWWTRRLWVCDAWDRQTVEWWHGRTALAGIAWPFDASWTFGEHTFSGLRWLYTWMWAYK